MQMQFSKYSSTGNDFIIVDNFSGELPVSDKKYWQSLCQRRTGIGSDGIIFLEHSDKADFHMRYLNADGAEVSMCGNGARAISHFYVQTRGVSKDSYTFSTMNGLYSSKVIDNYVWVEMTEAYDREAVDNSSLYKAQDSYYINTGVPHCVYLVADVEQIDLVLIGREIRHNSIFKDGVNVNFISKSSNGYKVRTYERGVEDETLSCGTGITACAHFLWDKGIDTLDEIKFQSRGGELTVKKDQGAIFFGGLTQVTFQGQLC